MTKTTALAGLALAALTLAGCGGSPTPGAGAPSAAPTQGPAGGGASSPAGDPTGGSSAGATTPAASPGAGAAGVTDPCAALTRTQVTRLTGVLVAKGTTQDVGGSKVCSWVPAERTGPRAAVFSAQEGPVIAPLDQVGAQLKAEFDGKVSPLTVPGADDARYLTGTKSGLSIVDVLAQKDGVFYQVLAASPRDASRHKAGVVKITEALLKA